ncbi:MAG: hypothetical protein NVSMB51_19350 [Solirubrobacteraceae bacterium]
MSQLYTCGRWTVRTGRKEAFVEAWNELAVWTTAEVPGASWATLLQDRDQDQRNRFLSFGP